VDEEWIKGWDGTDGDEVCAKTEDGNELQEGGREEVIVG
jgi:hypothetical protein